MQVLTVNTGSSSVRLTVYERGEGGLRGCGSEHFGVVHGGADLTSTTRTDAAAETEIERLAPLAPLHIPAALAWIRACREQLGIARTRPPRVPRLASAPAAAGPRCG